MLELPVCRSLTGIFRADMTRKTRKRKMAKDNNDAASPSPKRRAAIKATRRRRNNDGFTDDQPDLDLWLSQTQESNEEPQRSTSSCVVVTEAEIHHEPQSTKVTELTPEHATLNDSDTIDLALNIAKDTASVKSDIKRVENIINNNRNANASEHEALIMLLSSIQENVDKIDSKAACLDEKVRALSQKVTSQEKSLNKAQTDIETLFKTVSKIESTISAPSTAPAAVHNMDIDEQLPANISNSVVISNLPSRDKDEEDLDTLLYVGLCLNVDEVKIKSMTRDDRDKHSRPGNITVEFETLDQNIKVLGRKRNLNLTNEYNQIYIRAVKSHNELVMERNFSKLLQSLPTPQFRMASNGRIIDRF